MLIAGLVTTGDLALTVLWNVVIPLVPASLLISPAIWRNVCPLATVNMLSNGPNRGRPLGPALLPAAGMVGILLLGVMVPARRFLFNTDATVLAVTITAIAALALALGAFFDAKAGFCNAICPVLPVERLYGQHPLIELGNVRCHPCTLCTGKGCIDLMPTKSIAQTLGKTRRTHSWLMTNLGVFAAAFPGFVVGYYTTQDVPLASAGAVYAHVAEWALGSYLATASVVRVFDVSAARMMPILGATAAGLYYWFAAAVVAEALGLGAATMSAMRIVALGIVGWWVWRAMGQTGTRTRMEREHA